MMADLYTPKFENDNLKEANIKMAEKNFNNVRIVHKHDTAENWSKANAFVPKQGELIIYDTDNNYAYERMKVGDGTTLVSDLPFIDESIVVSSDRVTHENDLLSNIIDTYILDVDYDTLLAFDTSEIIIGETQSTSILGQAILGQLVLA